MTSTINLDYGRRYGVCIFLAWYINPVTGMLNKQYSSGGLFGDLSFEIVHVLKLTGRKNLSGFPHSLKVTKIVSFCYLNKRMT